MPKNSFQTLRFGALVLILLAGFPKALFAQSTSSVGLSLGYFSPKLMGEETISLDAGPALELYYRRPHLYPSLLPRVLKELSELNLSLLYESFGKDDYISSTRLSLLGGPLWRFSPGNSRKQALRPGILAGLTQESFQNSVLGTSSQGILFSLYFLVGYEYYLEDFTLEGYLRMGYSPDKSTTLFLPGFSLGTSYRF